MNMKYYVNKLNEQSNNGKNAIGLFKFMHGHKWSGEGNFCGWYGAEFYTNTTLIAYGIQLGHSNMYNPKRPFNGGFKVVNKYYDKIMIGSCYWTKQFKADSIEEAIRIFKNQEWEKYD